MKTAQGAPGGPATPEDRGTRARVLRLLVEAGPATAADLAGRLGLTSAGVRRHLDGLLADGLVEPAAERPGAARPRGRGRPARRYAVSPAGRDGLPHAYDDLATAALRYLAGTGGAAAVAAFARSRVAELEERYRSVVAAAAPAQQVPALAGALSADGYAASAERTAGGVQLCQHHCPVQHVAEAFPELCEAETAAFARLIGSHVQRLATLAHGDGVCTTYVPTGPEPVAGAADPDPTPDPDPQPRPGGTHR